MKYTVYMHTNKINGKKYIGLTNNTKRRWRGKGTAYKPSKEDNQNRPFWNAIQKYGYDNFTSECLYENLTFKDACLKEIECIQIYDTNNRLKGYNVSIGGNGGILYEEHPKGMLGKPQTEFQIENQRKWASVKENNCMTNGQVIWGITHEHPRGMLGKTHSEEYKKQVSKFMRENSPNFKKCYAVYPDGTKKEFKSPKFLCEYFGISSTSSSIYLTMKKQPYIVKPSSRNKRYDLEGITIEFESQ